VKGGSSVWVCFGHARGFLIGNLLLNNIPFGAMSKSQWAALLCKRAQ